MKQVLIFLVIIGVISLNFSHQGKIVTVPNICVKSDTDKVNYLKNKVWFIHPKVSWADTLKYMYIDSSLNVFLLSNVTASLSAPFVFAERYKETNMYSFIKRQGGHPYSEVKLTVSNTGKLIECYYRGICLTPACKTKSFYFSASELGITCCINHYPVRHCCKTRKEMADSTKVYKCVWQ